MQTRFSQSIATAVVFSVAIAAGCGGGGGSTGTPVVPRDASVRNFDTSSPTPGPSATASPTPPPTPTPTAGVPVWNRKVLTAYPAYTDKNGVYHQPQINGVDGMFSTKVGDTPSGGHGPAGSQIDNDQCQVSMSQNYHVHVFIGLYVNGKEYALPRGIGVADPKNPNNPSINYATQCFYFTHTHDSTGVLHIEDYNNGKAELPPRTSHFNMKTVFDVWGITVNASQFDTFTGPVRVYTSGQVYRGDQNNATVDESTLTLWNGDPNQIPLYSHEVIWFFVGDPSTYPTSLPSVHFAEEY